MSQWNFKWQINKSLELLKEDYIHSYRDYLTFAPHPITRSSAPTMLVPALTNSAIVYAGVKSDQLLAWKCLHLAWRILALQSFVKLEYQQQVIDAKSAGDTSKKYKFLKIAVAELNNILMLIAAAEILGIEDGKHYFAQQVISLYQLPNSRCHYDLISCPVTVLMLNVLMQDLGLANSLQVPQQKKNAMIAAVWENWNTSGEDILKAMTQFLDVKAKKLRNIGSADSDWIFGLQLMLNWAAPFESLYIQHVRNRLGLSNCLPSHPLLATPLCDLFGKHPSSGYNDEIKEAIDGCSSMLYQPISPPWEERFQSMPEVSTMSLIIFDK